jgi:hypothetical protein
MREFFKPKSNKWNEEIEQQDEIWRKKLEKDTELTRDDLKNISVDHSVIKEALRQIELRINHQNQAKERIDQRVYNLLTLFTSTVTAICGAIYYLFNNKMDNFSLVILIVFCFLSFQALYNLVTILKPYKYCDIGTGPDFWINKDILEGKINGLVGIIYDYYPGFKSAQESNRKRQALLDKSIQYYCGCIASFVIVVVISLFKQIQYF